MNQTLALRLAALFGLSAVVLGAFGAHALKDVLARNQTTGIWEKAVFYHFIHTIMLFLLADRNPPRRLPWLSFAAGIVVFSGSLYVLAATNVRWLGAITPLGGISFMVGWVCLAIAPGRGSSGPKTADHD
jgi:uncharacterized membrane protein YgdD (TMEM256/DUF423 family)